MGFTSWWTLPTALLSIAAAHRLTGAARVWLLLASSIAFYAALDPGALLPLGGVVLVSWLGTRVVAMRSGTISLALVSVATLAPLLATKYLPWLTAAWRAGSWWGVDALETRSVPPGLSFVSLQALGAVLDVRRARATPAASLRDHALFLAFFPQLIAGPIERAGALRPQLERPARVSPADWYRVAKLLVWAYALKLCVADVLAAPLERWLRLPPSGAAAGVWLALPLFAARLYLDFYAYSCIAVALGRAHGVELTQNFANPYGAASLTEFWRRWHISLSTWWRDYVYLPIGGRAARPSRQALAVLTVFLLSGLWHGAGIGFLLWGAVHGLGLLTERVGRAVRARRGGARASARTLPGTATVGADRPDDGASRVRPSGDRIRVSSRVLRTAARAATVAFVTVCWLPFLADASRPFPSLLALLAGGIRDAPATWQAARALLLADWWALCLAVCAVTLAHRMEAWYWGHDNATPLRIASDLALTNACVLLLVLFADFGGRSFIYFAF